MAQKSVLIVDDDASTCSSFVSLLESDAVVLRTASTLKEAEMLLESQTFDLVITDLHLTGRVGRQGLDLVSRIKARTPETPVVLYTGYGSPEIEREAMTRGAADYWEKPLLIPRLMERLTALGIPVGHESKEDSYHT